MSETTNEPITREELPCGVLFVGAGPATLASAIRLMDQLPEQQREILTLRVAVGLSTEETAAALGMTTGAVRVSQHRGLTKLRALLARVERGDVA